MNTNNTPLYSIYCQLYQRYGPQGWWPLLEFTGVNPTKTGSLQGYHPGEFGFPKTEEQRFEIALGAILTQNTNWVNVEKALQNLHQHKALSLEGLLGLSDEQLKQLIKPAGYFNQKAKKIRCYCEFVQSTENALPTRERLLEVWGIGPETADSILLYAWQQPVFVVDAYTRRILEYLELITAKASYAEVQQLFHQSLPQEWQLFQEYHALLVEHAKRFYSRQPWGKTVNKNGEETVCHLLESMQVE